MSNISVILNKITMIMMLNHFLITRNIKNIVTTRQLLKKFCDFKRDYLRRFYTSFKLKNYDLVYVFNVTPLETGFFEKVYGDFLSNKMIFDIDDLVYLNKSYKENKVT